MKKRGNWKKIKASSFWKLIKNCRFVDFRRVSAKFSTIDNNDFHDSNWFEFLRGKLRDYIHSVLQSVISVTKWTRRSEDIWKYKWIAFLVLYVNPIIKITPERRYKIRNAKFLTYIGHFNLISSVLKRISKFRNLWLGSKMQNLSCNIYVSSTKVF